MSIELRTIYICDRCKREFNKEDLHSFVFDVDIYDVTNRSSAMRPNFNKRFSMDLCQECCFDINYVMEQNRSCR